MLAALAGARLLGEPLGVGALFDPLDLPDVDLDAELLELRDRPAHQLRTQLGVIAVVVAADGGKLGFGRRDQQLEQEAAVVRVQPVGERPQPIALALVHRLVRVVRVVADENL